MKRTGVIFTALVLSVSLAACNGSEDDQSTNGPARAETIADTTGPTAREFASKLAGLPLDEALELIEKSTDRFTHTADDGSVVSGNLSQWTVIDVELNQTPVTTIVQSSGVGTTMSTLLSEEESHDLPK